jgi:2-keto-4-pentenoate hydratase
MTTPFELAARELADRRRTGRLGLGLAAGARPTDIEAALAMQRRVTELVGDAIGGWKCALPTPERTIVAPLFAATITSVSPYRLRIRGASASIEPEIAFVLDRDLPARATPYDENDLRAAIRETRLVLEVMGNRYADPAQVTFPEMLADFANNQGLFVGPVVRGGTAQALDAIPITIAGRDGVLMTLDGRHPDGHPLRPLVWLANFLVRRGDMLRAGQIVTTGSYAGARDVPLGEPLVVTFGALGAIELQLAAAS